MAVFLHLYLYSILWLFATIIEDIINRDGLLSSLKIPQTYKLFSYYIIIFKYWFYTHGNNYAAFFMAFLLEKRAKV